MSCDYVQERLDTSNKDSSLATAADVQAAVQDKVDKADLKALTRKLVRTLVRLTLHYSWWPHYPRLNHSSLCPCCDASCAGYCG